MIIFQGSVQSAVTPNDNTVLTAGALFVGTAGDIKLRLVGSSAVLIYKNIQDGTYLPLKADMVYATGTTASDIILIR